MKIRYFKCKKCSRTSAGRYDGKEKVQCGALIGFIFKDEDGSETPYGCGGELINITIEEATQLAYDNRS